MAYPLVKYNATTGSDTAPSDAAGTGTAASGTGSSTTITLGKTINLDGDGDGDAFEPFIWCETVSGDRHLFNIASYTGGTGACTAVVCEETIDATFSGANFHIGGTRKTIESDSSSPDEKDWGPGWHIEFAAGVYEHAGHWKPGDKGDFTGVSPGLEIRAASGAASRPIIRPTGNVKFMEGSANVNVKMTGLEFSGSVGGSNNFFDGGSGMLCTLVDCVVDTSALGSQPNQLVRVQYGNRGFIGVNTYFKGGDDQCILSNQPEVLKLFSCTIDGDGGTYHSTGGIVMSNGNSANLAIADCLIMGCGGDGITTRTNNNICSTSIRTNTVVDCGGNGIEFQDEAGVSDSSPMRNVVVLNNLVAFNTGHAFVTPAVTAGRWRMEASSVYAGNATFSNTAGAYTGQVTESLSGVTLSADPFTDRASGDYSLNTTSGGGAACTDAAYPPTVPLG